MPIKTTCIGAYPKPDFIQLPDWFNMPPRPDTADATKDRSAALAALGPEGTAVIDRGASQVLSDQVNAGIDLPTEGGGTAGELNPLSLSSRRGNLFFRADSKRIAGWYLGCEPANDLSLLEPFQVMAVILGLVTIAKARSKK